MSMDERLLAARRGVYLDREAERFGIGRARNGSAKGYPMVRGVRCLLPPPWSAEARWTAGALVGGDGALLTGESWLQAFGVVPPRPLAPVTVLISHDQRRRDAGFVRMERAQWPEQAGYAELLRLSRPLAADVGVGSARSTLTRLAAAWTPEEIRALLAKLSQQRITTPTAVLEWTDLHPRLPGAGAAAWAARELAGGEDSEGEVQFIKLAHSFGQAPDALHVNIFARGELLSITDAWWDIGVPGFYDGAVHFSKEMSENDLSRRDLMRDVGLAPFIATRKTLAEPQRFESRLGARLREAAGNERSWARTPAGVELFPHT